MRIEIGQYIEEEEKLSLLPEGAYYFTVKDYEVTEYSSERIQPCERVVLTLNIPYNGHNYEVKTSLILDSSLIWKTVDFFKSIGRKPQNGKYQIDFNNIAGKTGLAIFRRHPGSNGKIYLNADQFLEGENDRKLTNQPVQNVPPLESYVSGLEDAPAGTVVDLNDFERIN